MSSQNSSRTILFPHKPGAGGPGSFQRRFSKELQDSGWAISYANESNNGDVILIVGGTGKLLWLLKMKLKELVGKGSLGF